MSREQPRNVPEFRVRQELDNHTKLLNEQTMVMLHADRFIGKPALHCGVHRQQSVLAEINSEGQAIVVCKHKGKPDTCRRCVPLTATWLQWPSVKSRTRVLADVLSNTTIAWLLWQGIAVKGLPKHKAGPVLTWGGTAITPAGDVVYPSDLNIKATEGQVELYKVETRGELQNAIQPAPPPEPESQRVTFILPATFKGRRVND